MESWLKKNFYFSPENEKGGGGKGTSEEDGKKTEDNEGENKGKKPDENLEEDEDKSESKSKEKTGTQDDKKFTQADLDKQIAKRLEQERNKAEREKNEKAGEFQKLYEGIKPQYDAMETELTSLRERVEKHSSVLNANINATIKDWPEEVRAFDPGEDDAEKRQSWVEQATPLAKKLLGKPTAPDVEGGNKKKTEKSKEIGSSYMSRKYGADKPVKVG